MGSKYRHKYKAFGDAVLRSPAMVAEVGARAQRIKDAAEADASGYVDRGTYIESFFVRAEVKKPANGRTRRAVGTAGNDAYDAQYVEYGTPTSDAHHTLSRAADAG